jgi:hypothetical protein
MTHDDNPKSTRAMDYVYEFRKDRIGRAHKLYNARKSKVPAERQETWYFRQPFKLDGHKVELLSLDIDERNDRSVFHLRGCDLFIDPRIGYNEFRASAELESLSKEIAQRIWFDSAVVREAIETSGGLWREAIEVLHQESDYHPPFENLKAWDDYRRQVVILDFLVPGLGDWALNQVNLTRPQSYEVMYDHFDGGQTRAQLKMQPLYFTLGMLRDLVFEEINERRQACEHKQVVTCGVCGETNAPEFHSQTYWRFPGDLCFQCVQVSDYHRNDLVEVGMDQIALKQSMLDAVKLLTEITDFPFWEKGSLDGHDYYSLNLASRPHDEMLLLLKSFACLAQTGGVSPFWETKYHFLAEAGLEKLVPRGKGRGIRSISACNHLCLSEGERKICEALHKRQVQHDREPLYSELVGQGAEYSGLMRGDFIVGNLVIEFAGLDGDPDYDAKMALKRQLCDANGIPLLVIRPRDLKELNSILDAALN